MQHGIAAATAVASDLSSQQSLEASLQPDLDAAGFDDEDGDEDEEVEDGMVTRPTVIARIAATANLPAATSTPKACGVHYV